MFLRLLLNKKEYVSKGNYRYWKFSAEGIEPQIETRQLCFPQLGNALTSEWRMDRITHLVGTALKAQII